MFEDTVPVRLVGGQLVVTLPEHLGISNVEPVREQLSWVITRGAAALVADMSGTVSCDYSGTDVLACAYHRAVASGTQVRVVATGDVVRRVIRLSGLDPLVSIYPTVDAAIAAGTEHPDMPVDPETAAIIPAAPTAISPGQAPAADSPYRAGELLDRVIGTILDAGLSLHDAAHLPRNLTEQRIAKALRGLDDLVREVREYTLRERRQQVRRDLDERLKTSADRAALLHQRVAQAARALRSAASDTVTLLEERADLLDSPGRIDYPTEIKQWRAIADQAGQIAERWEKRV
jgi:anti-sigma B factor antagonist